MKKIILVLAMLISGTMANAQVDVITKHNGEVVKGKVVKLEEFTIIFKYDGEDAENTISKYAVEKIVYGKSGRIEEVTEKIVVSTEDDWEKVIILEEKGYIEVNTSLQICISMSKLPVELHQLKPLECEHFLCSMKDDMQELEVKLLN